MYALDFLATISNCDAEGRLKLCSALQMMQDCSEMWIDSEPVLKRFFGERGSTQLLVSRQVEIVRVPACKERLTVATSVFGMMPSSATSSSPRSTRRERNASSSSPSPVARAPLSSFQASSAVSLSAFGA